MSILVALQRQVYKMDIYGYLLTFRKIKVPNCDNFVFQNLIKKIYFNKCTQKSLEIFH